jgi:hypothetical protein
MSSRVMPFYDLDVNYLLILFRSFCQNRERKQYYLAIDIVSYKIYEKPSIVFNVCFFFLKELI